MAPKRILITSGDPDGIGWEITVKALNSLGPRPDAQFLCYRSKIRVGGRVDGGFKTKVVKSITEALRQPRDARTVIEIESVAPAARWVEEAAKSCHRHECQALVTAPLSKTSIIKAGMKDIGHTEILARITGVKDLFMTFIGSRFCVLLATGHLPLTRAIKSLKSRQLEKALLSANEARVLLPGSRKNRALALVGINPHAGEHGLIGTEEASFRLTLDRISQQIGVVVEGPLVPDAAFLPENWKRYSLYVCPYHDQGLIPFKMIHGFRGGHHLTLGLPFVRTSVDHGTAKDIFGKNKAQSGSMRDALLSAIRLGQRSSK